jgi:tripartite-type tricarboxylate transporter receptor subunit TctC
MNTKTFIIACIISILPCISLAEIPDKATIFVKSIAGTQHAFCYALFEEYDALYNSTTVVKVIPGASGFIATQQWARSIDPMPLFCGGMSEFAFNSKVFPENAELFAGSKPIITIATGPYVFTTRANSSFNTIGELKNARKHIFVGTHSETQLSAAKLVFGEDNITYVNYKSPTESIPDLLSGALDVYLSGGAFTTLTESGRLKTIGETLSNSATLSLDKEYPLLVTMSLLTTVFARPELSDNDVNELNRRLSALMTTDKMKNILVLYNNKFIPNTVQQTRTKVKDIITLVNRK